MIKASEARTNRPIDIPRANDLEDKIRAYSFDSEVRMINLTRFYGLSDLTPESFRPSIQEDINMAADYLESLGYIIEQRDKEIYAAWESLEDFQHRMRNRRR